MMVFAVLWGTTAYDRNFNPDLAEWAWNPGGNLGANVRTYRYAAKLAREGQSFYGVAPPELGEWAVYLYPPITVTAYYPLTGIDWQVGYWIVVALIASLVLCSPFTFGTIYYGNINLLVALAFVAGFLALDRDREGVAGAAFGLAALFKLFPALVGAWLLKRRSWRSVASATAVGVGGLLAGVVAYGTEPTVTFFSAVVFDRAETAAFVGGYPADATFYVTLQRPLSHVVWGLFPNAPPEVLTPLAALVGVVILRSLYADAATLQGRLIGIFATLVVTITLIPALQWYLVLLFFPMIPLWYVWDGPGRRLFLAGSAVLFANEYPGSLVEAVREFGFPSLLEVALVDVFTFATVPLYGIAIMLLACAAATHGVRPERAVGRVGSRIRAAIRDVTE